MPHQVFFRVDGGPKDGLGHIKRCITLSKTIGQYPNSIKPIFVLNSINTISQ